MSDKKYTPSPIKAIPYGETEAFPFSLHGNALLFYTADENPQPCLVQTFDPSNNAISTSSEIKNEDGVLVLHGKQTQYGTDTSEYSAAPMGKVLLEQHFKNGVLHGPHVENKFSFAQEQVRKNYADNKLNGPVERINLQTGITTLKVDYKDNQRHGERKEFDSETGQATVDAHYNNGQLIGTPKKLNDVTGEFENAPDYAPHEKWEIFGTTEADEPIPGAIDLFSNNYNIHEKPLETHKQEPKIRTLYL